MANLLVNPNAINAAPWTSAGAATSAATLQTAATGATSLSQTVAVAGGRTYQASVSVQAGAAAGSLFFAIYPTDYSTTYASQTVAPTQAAQTLTLACPIPAGVANVIFELDFNSTAGAIETITNAFFGTPGAAPGALTLLGCGA